MSFLSNSIGLKSVTIQHPFKKRENTKEFTKNLLELINEFSKVAGYKVKIQKLVAFLDTNNKLHSKEILKISFIITSRTIKYLRINSAKRGEFTLKTVH